MFESWEARIFLFSKIVKDSNESLKISFTILKIEQSTISFFRRFIKHWTLKVDDAILEFLVFSSTLMFKVR